MKPTLAHLLLLILTLNEVACYETKIPDFDVIKREYKSKETAKNMRRFKRDVGFRGYGESHFYGTQTKINNQFAEFVIQAATFALTVQRDRSFFFNVAKACKLLRLYVISLHFILYALAVVIPAVLGLLMAICVWQALLRQIDGCVKAPPDGSKLPPLANKPPGFYVPLHRRPLIYLQLTKEKCCGKKGKYQENVLRRKKRKRPEKKKKDEKKPDEDKKGEKKADKKKK